MHEVVQTPEAPVAPKAPEITKDPAADIEQASPVIPSAPAVADKEKPEVLPGNQDVASTTIKQEESMTATSTNTPANVTVPATQTIYVPGQASQVFVTVEPAESAGEPNISVTTTTKDAAQEEVTTQRLSESVTPLATGNTNSAVWAFTNLILVLVGILFAMVTLAIVIPVKKQRDDEEDFQDNETFSSKYRPRYILFGIVALLAVAGLVSFFVTENMSLMMVLTDEWTVLNATILIIETIVMIGTLTLVLRQREETGNTQEPRTEGAIRIL